MKKTITFLIFAILLCSCANYSEYASSSTTTSTTSLSNINTPTATITPTVTITPTATFTPSPTPLAGSGYIDFIYEYLYTEGEWESKLLLGSFEINDSQTYTNRNYKYGSFVKTVIEDSDLDIYKARLSGIDISPSDYAYLMAIPNQNIKFSIGSINNPNYILVTYIFNNEDQDSNPTDLPYEIFWASESGLTSIYKSACEDGALYYLNQDYILSSKGNFAIVRAPACTTSEKEIYYQPIIIDLNTGISAIPEITVDWFNTFSISPDEKKIAFDSAGQIFISDINGVIDSAYEPINGESPNWISDSQIVYIDRLKGIILYDLVSHESNIVFIPPTDEYYITDIAYLAGDEVLVFYSENSGFESVPCGFLRLNIKKGDQTQLFSTTSNWQSQPKNRIIWSPDKRWFIAEITSFKISQDIPMGYMEENHVVCRLDKDLCYPIIVTSPGCVKVNSDHTACLEVGEHQVYFYNINFR